MDPLFLIILVGLGLVFFYATRRSMRSGLPNLPPEPAVPPEADDTSNQADVEAATRQQPASAAKHRSRRQGQARAVESGSQSPDWQVWGRSPPAPGPQRKTATPTYRNPTNTYGPANAIFSSRAELRRAVVTMTVLGPCRALGPYSDPAASINADAATGAQRSG